MNMLQTRWGLGTVQLGLPYGNRANQPLMPFDEASAILSSALESNIDFFDTAPGYGISEDRLGEFGLSKHPVEIATKIPTAPANLQSDEPKYADWALRSINESLNKLRTKSITLVQFHQCDLEFLEGLKKGPAIDRILKSGTCKKLGVSVYTPEQAVAALAIPGITALQVPINLIDGRFTSDAFLKIYREKKIQIIARSIFLQGVLIEDAPLPEVPVRNSLAAVRNLADDFARSLNITLTELALLWVFGNSSLKIDVGLFGVDSLASLRQNIQLLKNLNPKLINEAFLEKSRDLQLRIEKDASLSKALDPSKWKV